MVLLAECRYLSYAGAPLLAQDRVIGIVGLYSKKQLDSFPATDLEHFQVIANHIGVAIVNDRLFKEVQCQKDELARQISERQQAELALQQSESVLKQATEQLQTLSRRLLELQETERRHIARELHDEIGQALTALKINLQAVQRLSDAASLAPRLLDSISIVDRTLRQVRNLSLDLRPSMLDDLGLCAALRWYTDQQAQRAGLRIKFVAAELDARLEPALKTACFRVAQEALTNIVRHAQASTVEVHLAVENDALHLAVRDDGVGFDPAALRKHSARASSLGLMGMEERASLMGGRIEVKSTPRYGTELHAWFPLVNGVSRVHPPASAQTP
jgi:signal transduction histidine kinase